MSTPSPDAAAPRREESLGLLKALWSLSWRLCCLLPFFTGALFCAMLQAWWSLLGCVVAFVLVAFALRRFSLPMEPDNSSVRPGGVFALSTFSFAQSGSNAQSSNRALELTASRRTTPFSMTFIVSPAGERVPARSSSACSR